MVLLVAVAIGRGWIDEPTRIGIAFGGSAAMLAAGRLAVRAPRRHPGVDAAGGHGARALFLTFAAGIQLYHLYPPPLALLEAALIGTVGMVLALRWDSRPIAGLSIGGALLAPAVRGRGVVRLRDAFILIALACAVGVLTMRRWNWLAVGCFVAAAPQLLAWVTADPGRVRS